LKVSTAFILACRVSQPKRKLCAAGCYSVNLEILWRRSNSSAAQCNLYICAIPTTAVYAFHFCDALHAVILSIRVPKLQLHSAHSPKCSANLIPKFPTALALQCLVCISCLLLLGQRARPAAGSCLTQVALCIWTYIKAHSLRVHHSLLTTLPKSTFFCQWIV
jgi:hypothetical protein